MADDATLTAEVHDLSRLVARLTPSWQRPEQFHEQKSEVIAGLRALSRRLSSLEPVARAVLADRPLSRETPVMKFVNSNTVRPSPPLPFVRARSLPPPVSRVVLCGVRRVRLRLLPAVGSGRSS